MARIFRSHVETVFFSERDISQLCNHFPRAGTETLGTELESLLVYEKDLLELTFERLGRLALSEHTLRVMRLVADVAGMASMGGYIYFS